MDIKLSTIRNEIKIKERMLWKIKIFVVKKVNVKVRVRLVA